MREVMFVSYYVLLNTLLARGQTYTSVVETASGPVRGVVATTVENVDYAVFLGIPYAKPPVGDLRFKPPLEVDAWTDVYEATTERNYCTQVNFTSQLAVGSEDCLYINVFTPHTKFNGLISKPVMVWIHGGGFTIGSSSLSLYSPDFLLGEDVIVVSFNYRLGALGFLNLEHENATGNYGLKDQNLALKWVKKNIAQFGGNSDQITIFGQNSGAASVDLQVLSDMSVGLFSQSISMSGSPLCYHWGFQTGPEAVQSAFILGSKLGTNTFSKDTLLETLHNASAADIVIATNDVDLLSFRPSLEKSDIVTDEEKFLTECSVTKYITGNYTKGPHMMGFVANESLSIFGSLDNLSDRTQSVLGSLDNIAASCLYDHTNAFTDRISGPVEDDIYQDIKQMTNLLFILGIDTKHKLISHNNGYPIYYYRFSFESNYSVHQEIGIDFKGGAGHSDDLPYIFYEPFIQLPLDQPDIAVTRQRMVKLFTNFAKYGNPTPDGEDEILGITWPDSRSNGEHLEIGTDLRTGPRPTDDAVKCLQLVGLGVSPSLNDCAKN